MNFNDLASCIPKTVVRKNILEAAEEHEKAQGIRFTNIPQSEMLKLRLTFLPMWIEINTLLKIGQELRYEEGFKYVCATNKFAFMYFNEDGRPQQIMPFEEFLAWNITFFAQKFQFHLLDE